MLFPTLKKKFGVKKKSGGGGGVWIFFLEKQFFLISRFMLFSTLKNIEKCPFAYWINGRWFLQIVKRDSWNLYPLYPLLPCSDLVSQMWGWFGGGGVMFFSHLMLFPTFLENGRWFLQIVDIGHFIMRLEILKSAPSLTG